MAAFLVAARLELGDGSLAKDFANGRESEERFARTSGNVYGNGCGGRARSRAAGSSAVAVNFDRDGRNGRRELAAAAWASDRAA
jgi:hypothetical protein